MKQSLTLDALHNKLQVIEQGKHDEIVPAHKLKVSGATLEGMQLTETAHRQLAEYTGIPWPYYRKVWQDQPDPALLEYNIRAWLEKLNRNLMLRCLTLPNGCTVIRAIKSDRFLPLDCFRAFMSIYQVVQQYGDSCQLQSADIDNYGDKMLLKITTPRMQGEVLPGDIVQSGLCFINSDTGMARLLMALLLFRLVCLNGAVMPVNLFAPFKRIHRGGQHELGKLESSNGKQNAIFHEFSAKATLALSSEGPFQQSLDALRQTTRRTFNSGAGALRVIGENYGLHSDEQLEASRKLEGNTQFSLVQAITRHSQDVKTYSRAHDLEELGGKLITLTEREWKPIAEATELAA